MNLQEQIAEFEAKGCVAGGVKWEQIRGFSNTYTTSTSTIRIDVEFLKNNYTACIYLDKGKDSWRLYSLNSTTLESALCEALEIVKAKVMDLAKELGIFDEVFGILNQIVNSPTPYNDREMLSWMDTARKLANDYLQLQQYIEEQGNE